MTSGRRNGRHERCPACRGTLAYIRPEMLILRRKTIVTDNAVWYERTGDTVRIRCRCGHLHEIRWSLLQR